MSERPIPELKPNPFAHFAKQSPPITIQSTLDEVTTSQNASIKSSSTRKKRKRDLPTAPAVVLSADEQPSVPPTKPKKHRKDRAESEFPNFSTRSKVPFGRTDSRERAVSSPPIIHRESRVHHGFLVPNDDATHRHRDFLAPKKLASSSGVSERGLPPSNLDPTLEPVTPIYHPSSIHKPAPSSSNYAALGLSRKSAADHSLRSDDQLKVLLKRMAELEIVQQEHANALVHIAELHYDVQELKEKQTELHTIVIKLSAGQALSPAEAKKVTDENNNTVKEMIRRVLIKMMGDPIYLPDNPPKAEKGESRYWVSGVADEKLLRPDFATSWSQNKFWHKTLWEQIQARGTELVPACTPDMIADIGEKKMLQLAGRATFKHLKERYTKERKSPSELARDKKEKIVQARKAKKAKARSEIRNQFPSLGNKEYTFIFHKDWQSSDYTSDDSDLDVDVAKSGTSASSIIKTEDNKFPVLKTCEPDYRSPLLAQIYDDLDTAVRRGVREADADKKKNGKKPRRRAVVKRGFVTEKIRLPDPHNSSMVTHRWAVDAEWLATHGHTDQPITDSDNETAAPTWKMLNIKGKDKDKEIYHPKPNGPTNGVPDVWAEGDSSESSESSESSSE